MYSPTGVADADMNVVNVLHVHLCGLAFDGLLQGGDFASVPHQVHTVLPINSDAWNNTKFQVVKKKSSPFELVVKTFFYLGMFEMCPI